MASNYAVIYGYDSRCIERIASCRFLIDAVVLYYLNPLACYIIYEHRKYKEPDIARVAYDNIVMLHEYFGNSKVYNRIEASVMSYIDKFAK